jgi:hypothetical protein
VHADTRRMPCGMLSTWQLPSRLSQYLMDIVAHRAWYQKN